MVGHSEQAPVAHFSLQVAGERGSALDESQRKPLAMRRQESRSSTIKPHAFAAVHLRLHDQVRENKADRRKSRARNSISHCLGL